MKTFNLKIAAIIFLGVAAMDTGLWILEHYKSDTLWVYVPWCVVNFPSIPLGCIIKTSISFGWLWGCTSLFSALMWSWFAGLYFRHDNAT